MLFSKEKLNSIQVLCQYGFMQEYQYYKFRFSIAIRAMKSTTLKWNHPISTDSSCGKVIFSQACVKNSVHRGLGCKPLGRHTPSWADSPLGRQPPWVDTPWAEIPTSEDHCSGRYASYWNAFLFYIY